MRSICLMDTSVFCNWLKIPGRDQDREEVIGRIEQYVKDGTTLLLPIAAIIETGNHIAHVADGNSRREAAQRFVKAVGDAIDGEAPWTPTPVFEIETLRTWLAEFPDCATVRRGFGDLTIIKEFERQCELHKGRRVFIWSLDGHLWGYDRAAVSF